MPEQVDRSVTELMDLVLDDLRQNERITGLFTNPLRSMVHGIKGLDERFDDVDRRFDDVDKRFDKLGRELGQVHDNVNVLMARFEYIGRYIERDERSDKKAGTR